jgi:hypothetical protein
MQEYNTLILLQVAGKQMCEEINSIIDMFLQLQRVNKVSH